MDIPNETPTILPGKPMGFDPWMSRLDGSRKFTTVTIPGSHDSATENLYPGGRTQAHAIDVQLFMGVRHFDIRVDSGTSDLHVVHGGAPTVHNTQYSLADVVATLRDFLIGATNLPSHDETVFLQIKIDRGSESDIHAQVTKTLNDVFGGHAHRLHLDAIYFHTIPTMQDLRGKLVLVRRYETKQEDRPGSAIPVKFFAHESDYAAWNAGWRPNVNAPGWLSVFRNRNFEWPDKGARPEGYRNRHGQPFVIQDNYGAGVNEKWKLIHQFLDAAVSRTNPDTWYLNFTSTTPPEGSADEINPLLLQWFLGNGKAFNYRGLGYGSIMMDFVQPALVDAVVAANF